MGLDITAYGKLIPIPGERVGDWIAEARDVVILTQKINTSSVFPGRTEGLEPPGTYWWRAARKFKAGSYTGYREWRHSLSLLAGYKSLEDCWENHTSGPFWELINFTDSDGVIGPVVSRKLLADFLEYRPKLDACEHPDKEWFAELYDEWQRAFEVGSDSGAVVFH